MSDKIDACVARLRDQDFLIVQDAFSRFKSADSDFRHGVLKGLSTAHEPYGLCQVQAVCEGATYKILAPHACRLALTLLPLEHDQGVLELRVSRERTLTNFANMPSLHTLELLELDGMYELQTLSGLEGASRLHTLYLSQCENLTDVTEIGQLTTLHTLGLSGCGSIGGNVLEDLRFLNSLHGLAHLSLSDLPASAYGLNGWHSAENSSFLPMLQELNLSYFQGYDLAPMDNAAAELIVPSVRTLDLSSSPELGSIDGLLATDVFDAIKEADESWWAEQAGDPPETPRRWSRAYFEQMLPRLEAHACASWARPQLMALQELRLSECKALADIDCLRLFPQLQRIDLSFTGITSAAALIELENLEYIDLRGCEKLRPELQHKYEGKDACSRLRSALSAESTVD